MLYCCFASAAVAAKAQSGPIFEIDIGFDFVVKDIRFPAGRYRLGRLNPDNPDILILKNTGGNKKTVFLTQRLARDSQKDLSELVFYRFGNIYFLNSVWPSGQKYGSLLRPCKSELKERQEASKAQMVSLKVKQ